eukprot:scaffold284103_cov23-Prasinocladus_malaysianus.AAC.1
MFISMTITDNNGRRNDNNDDKNISDEKDVNDANHCDHYCYFLALLPLVYMRLAAGAVGYYRGAEGHALP